MIVGSELGFATHFVSSRTVPNLLSRLSDLEDPTPAMIDRTIEEHHTKRLPDEPVGKLTGRTRHALDMAFRHDRVEEIVEDLTKLASTSDDSVAKWASETLEILYMRSPTSLKVALEAVRRGKEMTLLEALQMEMGIATAYCVSLTIVIMLCDLFNLTNAERCKFGFRCRNNRGPSRESKRSPCLVS
jgi:3-hydroxyisobutyryl-CoA hydrolase